MPVTMNLILTLDGVTYGELYEFVDAVRAAGVPADERVRCLGSDDKGDRFEVDLGPDRRRAGSARAASGALVGQPVEGPAAPGAASSSSPTVASVAETVRSMVRNGDDLDRVIAALGDLRKFLR
ncbi:hypothetical protein ACIQCV_08225 [Dietzia maris]|jgi:hypothetical protein|uniref:hypothetical protein n=1 Tax=Dietzia TaxID=37914 RepID=UPI0022B2F6A2|nr:MULTISPECIES: hypothetical protein [Dietzia]MCZ4541176.1 hypothetical protein [Dietzia maris]MCZ4656899.1 hypothetical protein [Dietzia kunjamensis]MDV3355882.1 hypothetical protein [Dietzia sp. IN118]